MSLKTPAIFAACLALSGFGLSGCGLSEEDAALEQLPIADEEADGKADGLSSYAWVRPSIGVVRCLRAPCASNIARAVNAGDSRTVYTFDLRSLYLSSSRKAEVNANLDKMLLRGKYATVTVSGESMPVFQVTRALEPSSGQAVDNPSGDTYYSVAASNVQCVMDPCPQFSATKLNGTSKEMWEKVELSQLKLTSASASALTLELRKGGSVISTSAVSKNIPTATQAFRPVK